MSNVGRGQCRGFRQSGQEGAPGLRQSACVNWMGYSLHLFKLLVLSF